MAGIRFSKRALAYAAGAALTLGGVIIALGPAAPGVIDQLADNQRVWRLGRIQIDGVHGPWLGALRAERISIADEEGVWFEAQNVDLDWRPQSLLGGGVWIDAARADAARILRQPILSPARPSGGGMIDVHIAALGIADLRLDEAVVGEAADFTANLSMDLRDDALRSIDLSMRRTDSNADNIVVLYRAADYAMLVNIAGPAGGVLSNLLGVPDQAVRIQAAGDGDLQTGGARYEGFIGQQRLLEGETRWTATQWTSRGEARLDLLPGLAETARRIGANATLDASGERASEHDKGLFRANAATPFFAVELSGALNHAYELDGPARFTATADRLSDIARESPFELGAARLEGELRQANGVSAIRANLDARDMEILGRSAHFTGPIEASLSNSRFELDADLRAAANSPPLFQNARLQTDMSFDRGDRRYRLARATIDGDAFALDARGWVEDGDGEFSGEWRVKRLGALAGELTGAAAGRWRAHSELPENAEDHIWIAALDGNGERIGGAPEILPQLVGPSPRLDGLFRYENGVIDVNHIRIDGRQFRAAASGQIVRGDANLALEASARGPLNLGGAEIGGAIDATGRVTGRLASPTLSARAQMSSFTASVIVIGQPQIDFTLAPAGRAYRGRADVTGNVSGQVLTATSDVSVADGALALSNLAAQAGELEARGSASIASRGVTAELALNGKLDGLAEGVRGAIDGALSLTPQNIALQTELTNARFGELRIRTAQVRANGPLDAIQAQFDMSGALRQAPLTFAGTAQIANDRGATQAQIQGRGALAGAGIATRTPITAIWRDGGMEGSLDVTLADGALVGRWTDRGRALAGEARVTNAPLAPLAAIYGEEATGRINGQANLANAGGGLSGGADLRFDDARFASRQRGTLDLHVVGDLDPGRVNAVIDATSSEGLVAHFEADAPVATSAAPIRIALARERRGRANWSVRGPADALWAVTRLQDQALTGQIEGEGELEFGAGYLSGDGHVEIVDGRFEDKLTGIVLTDLDARVAIGQSGVSIERFTAAGARGGRLTATGGSTDPQHGRIQVDLDNIWLADRGDARARGSGDLTLRWEGLDADVTGHLELTQAEVNIAQNPEAGIATIDVVEINRPGDEDLWLEDSQTSQSPRAASTNLDVTVRAPGRVFTRGRGLEAEWSLDLRLSGTAAEPRVFGEAEIVRGQLALSGQPFNLERGRILFNGSPMNARVDLLATRSTADLTANILVSGAVSTPDITLTSTPPLPEDEILPQVLFGHSVEDLSPLEAAQIATALASLSGAASFDLIDTARAAAGLDRFNVRQDESGGLLVSGGVYLTREVYVEVSRDSIGQAATSVEWTVRPQLVLITSFLGNGDQRVSLRWRRESD
jgi:translocation and assembly module TamB